MEKRGVDERARLPAGWHTHRQLAATGVAIVESFVDLVNDAVPDAGPVGLSQKKSMVWRRDSDVWLRCYTDKLRQAALEIRSLDRTPADQLAQRLGWAVFDRTDELSAKRALGSSVGLDPSGHMRFIIKSLDDIRGSRPALAGIRLIMRPHQCGAIGSRAAIGAS